MKSNSKPKACAITGQTCPLHEYVHGREAEELRSGIEKIIARRSGDPESYVEHVLQDMQALVDRVDARDSLAYVEVSQRKRGKRTAA